MNKEGITTKKPESSPIWENLEEWIRGKIQHYIQNLLEVEVTELLGREKSEGRSMIDEKARLVLERDWERMTTFYRYPKKHWRHLRTTNPIESPFASVRLRTNAAKRYKKVANATAVIWKTLIIADRKFRRLNAPELLKEVYEGARYVNGIRVKEPIEADAA